MKSYLLGLLLMVFLPVQMGYAWTLSADYWPAKQSKFEEHQKAGTGHVWGNFGTDYSRIVIENPIFEKIRGSVALSFGSINDNTMYLNSSEITTRFNGTVTNYLVGTTYRLMGDDQSYTDISAGYFSAHGNKEFYDKTVTGTITDAGNWGRYVIDYSGLQFNLKGAYRFSEQFGVLGEVMGRPSLRNNTDVTGVGKDSTSGNSFGFLGELDWVPSSGWTVAAGYRFEKIYFEPTGISYDLSIEYGGPYVKVSTSW